MLPIVENKKDKKYIQILPAPTEGATEILEKISITNEFTQCKTSRTLKIDVFEIPYNKNIGKLLSKYELLLLDQANSSSDPTQILIL